MIGCEWTPHPKPLLPAQVLEDFVVLSDPRGGFLAYYTKGPGFQNQRVYSQEASSPLGPFSREVSHEDPGVHCRISRGDLGLDHPMFVSSGWESPKVGIWAHWPRKFGRLRTLILPPGEESVVANPCASFDPSRGEYDIIYEATRDPISNPRPHWRLMHAAWRPGAPAKVMYEICVGANPSLLVHEGVRYLYYSKLTSGGYSAGFETRVLTQPERKS